MIDVWPGVQVLKHFITITSSLVSSDLLIGNSELLGPGIETVL